MRWVRIRRRGRPVRKGTFVAWLLMLIVLVVSGSVIGEMILLPVANPPERHKGWVLSERGDKILRRACFDCHSNETRWPWYSYVPPVSVLIVWDVANAREHLNFSRWSSLPEPKQIKAWKKSLDELREKEMPLPRYLPMHPEAVITEADLATMTEVVAKRYGAAATEKPGHDDEHEHEK